MNATETAARVDRPPRPLPPPDPPAIVWPRLWYARPDLSTVTPAWARIVLPRTIHVLVPGPRSNHPLLKAGVVTALLCLAWGCLIGGCAGAMAGTMIIPLFGTAYGGLIG